mmetsp:Transcript_41203/g.96277  ORF Transcript_41203/g.96277 Transcript_41203/m.96277 type:complete len:371 (+) Transcript_41203:169-1281(+)
MLDRKAGHQAAGPLGEEADDLVVAVLPVLELAVDDARLQHLAVGRAEVLLRRQVDDDRRLLAAGELVQVLGQPVAPVVVEAGAGRRGQPRAHLQPVGLHAVQRAQDAVQARQHAHMLLGPGQVLGAQGFGIQAVVDVAVEGQHRRLAVALGEARTPGGVAFDVQLRERLGEVHQRPHLLDAVATQYVDQRGRVGQELRAGQRRRQFGRRRRVVVERLGGREQEQHGRGFWPRPGLTSPAARALQRAPCRRAWRQQSRAPWRRPRRQRPARVPGTARPVPSRCRTAGCRPRVAGPPRWTVAVASAGPASSRAVGPPARTPADRRRSHPPSPRPATGPRPRPDPESPAPWPGPPCPRRSGPGQTTGPTGPPR